MWEEHQTLGEFDGRVKYGRLLRPGQRPEDVLWAEKLREDALRDLGWQVVRWTWADLDREGLIADRLHRAFRRSTGQAGCSCRDSVPRSRLSPRVTAAKTAATSR